jgi:hypothetical protein
MSKEAVEGFLSSLRVFEATVVNVDTDTGDLHIVRDLDDVGDPEIIPPVYYGGLSGTGLFQHPEIGDTVICTRVYPGARGITQALRVIPKSDRQTDNTSISSNKRVRAGTPEYPTQGLSPGDIRILGLSGSRMELIGEGEVGSGLFVGGVSGDGLYVKNNSPSDSALTVVSDSIKSVSSATREYSRSARRFRDGDSSSILSKNVNSKLKINDIDHGHKRGIFSGVRAALTGIVGGYRNPGLAEYRFVANEFSETDGVFDWDSEHSKRDSKSYTPLSGDKIEAAMSPDSMLHLASHQLVEVIVGNVINRRGELLDINYNPVITGDAFGRPTSENLELLYEKTRLESRRSIGYHFQLSKNTLSNEISNSYDNFIFSIDKEGALKVNVPSTSNSGNIMYPALADFYTEKNGSTPTSYGFDRKYEKIPITLRDRTKGVVYPPESDSAAFASKTSDGQRRYTGIRHSNDNNYFRGFSGTSDDADIRVNPTKHHNMYAAAEMLIANTIDHISIPTDSSLCTGYLPGNPVGKSFERKVKSVKGDYEETPYMCTVHVEPGSPALNTGGGVIVAGREYVDEFDKNGVRKNIQYANEFSLSKSDKGIGASNSNSAGEKRLNPGGKSANINFDGSIEMSVGQDGEDKKSILLDAAGSMVAWFGRDEKGRSLIVQTDGSALFNIGGVDGDSFNKGSLDIRVNVVDKGFVGEEDYEPGSDYIISISEKGLVIAGMNPAAPMVIRNEGNLCIESSAKLILSAQTIEMREGNRPARKSHSNPASTDTPDAASVESVMDQIDCLMTQLSELND